jgi:hypothetical protein
MSVPSGNIEAAVPTITVSCLTNVD